MSGPLTVLSDLSERLHYNVADFPLYTKKDELRRYGYAALCHWHRDLEFIYINDGKMDYFVNGKIIHMEKGQGIFVNSRRLHYGFSNEHAECTFTALVIHPSIFIQNTQVGNDYFERKFGLTNADYIRLDSCVDWQNEILKEILTVHQCMQKIKENPLMVVIHAIEIIELTGEHLPDSYSPEKDMREQITFLNMTAYIESHYYEKITLEILAHAANISRSAVCILFQRFVKETPGQYLQNFRIEKSAELLRDTSLSITDIAGHCGFSTPGYYTSVFHKAKGLTPKAYRKFYEK